jgi:CubicO group peptidase (beta-lactamase class C family)
MNKRMSVLAILIIAALTVLIAALLIILRKPEENISQPKSAPAGWKTSTPEEQGFDSTKLAEGLQELWENKTPIDSILIIRNGYLVLDAYFYPYEPSFPHNLESVTKSVTTSLIAIADEQGKLQLDKPIISFFPERTTANLDQRKESITVRHLAGMVNGMSSGCLYGDVPTLQSMFDTADWVQAALDREMVGDPGETFCYDSPGMHLLSAILQQTTGMTELEFARKYLFEPLGIEEVYWEPDPQGYTHGWGDLWLKPPDAAKIGYLFLNNGVWEGRQIVPSAWIAEATKTRVSTGTIDGYGYGWWVADDSYFALGHWGQYIRVYPEAKAVVVITARGVEYESVETVLEAYINQAGSLPSNPEAVAMLDAVLDEIKQGPGSEPVTSSPEIAKLISGKTYRCEANTVEVTRMRIEFNDPSVAYLFITYENGQEVSWPIGLDGKYRMTTEWKGVRGYWLDEQTFAFQAFYNLGPLNRSLELSERQMVVNLPDMNLSFTCKNKPGN